MRILNNSDVMLALVYNHHKPKKDIKKLAIKLMKKTYPEVAKGVLTRIADAPNPATEIIRASNEVDEFKALLEQVGNEGYYGVAVRDSVLYPIEFIFEDSEDEQWAIENENMMRIKCAHALMNLLNLKRVKCQVVLFGTKGFSADYVYVEVAKNSFSGPGVIVTDDKVVQ